MTHQTMHQMNYSFQGFHGMGFGFSSMRSVLAMSADLFLEGGEMFDPHLLIKAAVESERRAAGGRGVAAADVAPIVHGGVIEVVTGDVVGIDAISVDHDPDWIARHVLIGVNLSGQRHNAPDLLAGLLNHPDAGKYVAQLSALADQAAAAIGDNSVEKLGKAVNGARQVFFDEWGEGTLEHPETRRMAAILKKELGASFVAWKHPGAGGATSILVITRNRQAALQVLKANGWQAAAALAAPGLKMTRTAHGARFHAPCRVDFVGAADLGQDSQIRAAGKCCSMAIYPTSEVELSYV